MDPITKLVSLGAAGAGGESYWILTKSSSNSDYAYDVDFDPSGNIIAFGMVNNIFDTFYILKLDKDGGKIWERYARGSGGIGTPYPLTVDDSGNAHISGRAYSLGDALYIAQLNSAGTAMTWSKKYSKSGQGDHANAALAHDSSGNIYAGGYGRPTSSSHFTQVLSKVNSSGTLQWVRYLDSTSVNSEYIKDIAVSSSGDIYIISNSGYGSNGSSILIAKFNSSGTLQNKLYFGGSGEDSYGKCALDSSNNFYVTFGSTIGTYRRTNTAKFNSSLTLQWERSFYHSGNTSPEGIAVDSSGNVFTAVQISGTSGPEDVIVKYNSSGVLQYQTGLDAPGNGYVRISNMVVDDSDSLLVSAYGIDYSSSKFAILKLPTDVAVTNGTYGDVTFNTTSFSDSAGSSTVYSGSISEPTASGYSASNISITYGSNSLTSSLTTI